MPPKVKTTKEDIINVAVDIVRKSGEQGLNARNIAKVLECSTQPIFSNFSSMDQLRFAVIKRAEEIFKEYMERQVKTGEYPVYKASGMAYISFAKEEKELFRLLYMRDRSQEQIDEKTDIDFEMENIVYNNTGLEGENNKIFHLEMWAYVHGIAVMFATNYFNPQLELVSKMLTDSYQGLRKQYELEG